MAKRSVCDWGLWGGLFVGLLCVVGCRSGAATAPRGPGEPRIVEAPPVAVPEDRSAEAPAPDEVQAVEDVPVVQEGSAGETGAATAVELALRFVAGQDGTYRIITEGRKSVAWKGNPAAQPEWFSGGDAGNRLEMVFTQRVQQVEPEGNAVVGITIEALKYLGQTPKKVTIDFDSERPGDSGSPLKSLIGKGYRLRMSPKGQVLAVMDVEPARQAVQGGSAGAQVAMSLLRDDEIRKRHAITPLTPLQDPNVRVGQTWSDIRTFSFGQMGRKSYERLYTLSDVRTDDGRVAVVEMEGVPPRATDDKSSAQVMPMMMDATGRYEGRLELDLDSGQVRLYAEQMRSAWVVADPSTLDGDAEPAALEMAATLVHRLERIE